MSIDTIVRLFLIVQPLIRKKDDEVSYAPYKVFTIDPNASLQTLSINEVQGVCVFRHSASTRCRQCASIWSRGPETTGGGTLTSISFNGVSQARAHKYRKEEAKRPAAPPSRGTPSPRLCCAYSLLLSSGAMCVCVCVCVCVIVLCSFFPFLRRYVCVYVIVLASFSLPPGDMCVCAIVLASSLFLSSSAICVCVCVILYYYPAAAPFPDPILYPSAQPQNPTSASQTFWGWYCQY